MARLTLLLLLLLALLNSEGLKAQAIFHSTFDINNGLPSNETHQVFQDKEGWIWICTDHGVVRYDGYEFQNYTTQNNLAHNTIFDIYSDHRDRLWFMSLSGGISYWENGQIHQPPQNRKMRELIHNQGIVFFAVDSNDVLYFSVREICGLFAVFPQDSSLYFQPMPQQPGSVSLMLIEDKIATLVYQISPNRKASIPYKLLDRKIPFVTIPLPGRVGYHFYDNRHLVFGPEAVFEVHPNGRIDSLILTENSQILNVYIDKQQNLWLCTQQGLLQYSLSNIQTAPKTFFKGKPISNVHQDQEGNYWITSLDGGVFLVQNLEILLFLPNNPIADLLDGGDYLMAIGTGNEVYEIALESEFATKVFEFPFFLELYGGAWTGKDSLMLTTGFSLYKQDEKWKQGPTVRPSGQPVSGKVFQHSPKQNLMLFGTSNGLFFRKGERNTGSKRGKRTEAIGSLSDSSFLLGTVDGLQQFDLTNQEIKPYRTQPQLNARVLALERQGKNWWLGTKGDGLFLMKEDRSLVQYTVKDGLSSNFVRAVAIENDSTLWLGTNKGVNYLQFREGKINKVFQYYHQKDLLPNSINDILVKDSNIWLATDKGVVKLPKPVHRNRSETNSPLYLKKVSINGQDWATDKHYDLQYFENNIAVHFRGIRFSTLSNLDYRYRFSGTDTSWLYTSSPHLNFNNLSTGDYHLQIQVSQVYGGWQQDGLNIHFLIHPHFTQTWWFWLLLVLLFIGSLLIYLWNVNQKNTLERAMTEAKQTALRSQMKPHFLFNVINSVSYFVYRNDKKQALHFLQLFSKLMRGTLENSLKEMLPLTDDLEHLQLYLTMEQQRLTSGSPYQHDFRISINEGLEPSRWRIPPMLVQPLVENAIVHGLAPKEGDRKLVVELKEENSNLVISVRDNGIGRVKAKELKKQFSIKKTSQGLNLLQQQLKALQRLLKIDISFVIEDLTEEKNGNTGTISQLIFPNSLKF